MLKLFVSAFVLCLLTVACDKTTPLFVLPLAPTGGSSSPPPAPVPQPRPFAPFAYTEIAVGQAFNGQVNPDPPECVGLAGWPCQYFRMMASTDGTLVVELNYKPNTQPGQGVDVSIDDPLGRATWADYFQPSVVRARVSVTAGTVYQITLWYTFSGLEFELETSLQQG